jgi:methionyl-tRNA formyltransferase
MEESPVKKLALKHNLKIEQPETLKNSDFDFAQFELGIVAQYGLILPKKVIDSFPKGTINVHGSLLPKYRGASPIQAALISGEKETGVTIMLMDEKMDHGPILSQKTMSIDPDDTFTILASKMAVEGSLLLLETLPKWLDNKLEPITQDESQVTLTKLLTKEDGLIDFGKTNDEIYNQYRGLTPWPGIWCVRNDKRLKLLKTTKSDKELPIGDSLVEEKRIFIGCGKGSIEILELQLEGKGIMNASTFLNGYKV